MRVAFDESSLSSLSSSMGFKEETQKKKSKDSWGLNKMLLINSQFQERSMHGRGCMKNRNRLIILIVA